MHRQPSDSRDIRTRRFRLATLATALILLANTALAQDRNPSAQAKQPAKTPLAWTADEARRELALNPRDPFLQYVALQLSADAARKLNGADEWRRQLAERRGRVDAFNLFTGALAVQESLQLDAMTGAMNPRGPSKIVPFEKLQGPTIKSHPWEKMLGDQQPEVSPLAKLIPSNQYLVQARSLTKLLDLVEIGDLWSMHLFNQAVQEATSSNVGDRLREQLAVRTDPLSKPFYDMVVDQVAITGSDLYLREGSDVTVIFALKQPAVFAARMNKFLDEAKEKHPTARRMHGEYLGVKYIHIASPDRKVHVFSAYPRPDLHIRSNSRIGLERVLAAMQGRDPHGQAVERLGETAEFRYIRTLMEEGAVEEDAFIYLSDSFIRHIIGPRLKLTERRRLIAYNHMRMIGHAALLYRTQFGKQPDSIQQLVDAKCAPASFADGSLQNPFGGQYSLAPDGLAGLCSVNGLPSDLIPNAELPLENVTQEEANDYQQFLDQYNSYWRTFFDPIAIRVKIEEKKYRAETIVLPLINNSIYNVMATTLGGEPEPLDKLPVPKGNIFSLALRVNKHEVAGRVGANARMFRNLFMGSGPSFDAATVDNVILKGFGNQVGLHIYDSAPLFDLNLSNLVGEMFASGTGGMFFGNDTLWITVLIASLNSPLYVSLDVNNEAIVDAFLEQLDKQLAALARRPSSGGWFRTETDFYHLTPESVEQNKSPPGKSADQPGDATVRAYALAFGPLKWRFFSARIGKGFYVATKKFIIDDLIAAHREQIAARKADGGKDPTEQTAGPSRWQPRAHAMVRVRPEHWNRVLPEYQLGWAENNRRAVLNHLSMLSNVARAAVAADPDLLQQDPTSAAETIVRQAEILYGVHFVPPDGGKYLLSSDGRSIAHSLYGSQINPQQHATPATGGKHAELLKGFSGATAELTFLEDGLHAVLTIERKEAGANSSGE
ncbi:MAG: hypothetical protein WD894_01610 [Pirellulales bacterium]